MRLTALSFCAVLVRYWLAVCTDSFEHGGDLLAGLAVGGQLQAFELALGDRRHACRRPPASAGSRRRTARSSGHGFRQTRVVAERNVGAEENHQPGLAAIGIDRKGDARRCRRHRRPALPTRPALGEGRVRDGMSVRSTTSTAPSRRPRDRAAHSPIWRRRAACVMRRLAGIVGIEARQQPALLAGRADEAQREGRGVDVDGDPAAAPHRVGHGHRMMRIGSPARRRRTDCCAPAEQRRRLAADVPARAHMMPLRDRRRDRHGAVAGRRISGWRG